MASESMLVENAKEILLKDWIDIEIVDRKEQQEELKKYILKPIFEHQTLPMNVYIYGSSGSGKTFLIKNFEKEILRAKSVFPRFYYMYYNCGEEGGSFYSLILDIINLIAELFPFYINENNHETFVEKPERGLPLSDCIRRLNLAIEKFKPTILLVLDEVEKLKNYDQAIKWFLEQRKKYNSFYGLSTVFISNDPYLLEKIKQETRSRIPLTIHFTPYNVQDFYEIAKVFIKKTFRTEVENEWIIKIARKVNEISSSVRDLKTVIYFVGEIGEISDNAIEIAIDKSQKEIFKKEILSRPIQQRLILFSIASFHKRICSYEEQKLKGLTKFTLIPTIGNIFHEYKRIANKLAKVNPLYKPREYRTFFNIIKSLEEAQLIRIETKALGKGRGRTSFIYPKEASWEYYYEILKSEFGEI